MLRKAALVTVQHFLKSICVSRKQSGETEWLLVFIDETQIIHLRVLNCSQKYCGNTTVNRYTQKRSCEKCVFFGHSSFSAKFTMKPCCCSVWLSVWPPASALRGNAWLLLSHSMQTTESPTLRAAQNMQRVSWCSILGIIWLHLNNDLCVFRVRLSDFVHAL